MTREHKDAEFIDAIRELLGLSPWYGSERSKLEGLQRQGYSQPAAPAGDSGNRRTLPVDGTTNRISNKVYI